MGIKLSPFDRSDDCSTEDSWILERFVTSLSSHDIQSEWV